MTTFDSRQKGFETKFAMDEEARFKAEARAAKRLGLWAAEKLGKTGADADTYAKTVMAANLDEPGFGDVIKFVDKELQAAGIKVDISEIQTQIDVYFATAAQELKDAQ